MSADFKGLNQLAGNTPEPAERAKSGAGGASCASLTPPAEWRASERIEAGTESVGLDEVFSRLWRRRRTLLCMALAGVATAALITVTRSPVYRARTAIQLEGLDDRYQNLGGTLPFAITAANAPTEAYLQNELKILESEKLAKRVADLLAIRPPQNPHGRLGSLPAFLTLGRRTPSADDLKISAVKRSLTIRSSLKSQVVEVFFDSKDPALAAKGANAVVSEYVAINRQARLQATQDTTGWLAGQIADLKAKLDHGNEQLQSFARSTGLLYAGDQSLLTEQSVREVEEQLSKAHADRAAKQALYETAISNSPESLPNSADSGLLREYEGKLAALQGELIQLQSLYTSSHYKVIDAKVHIAQLESVIKNERRHMMERMRTEYQSADRLERALANTYRAQTQKLEAQTGDAFRYNVLKRELDNTQQLYNSLLQKAKEAGVASALHATSIRVIDVATPPAIPYSPNLRLNCAIGFSAGLFFGVALILVRERGAIRVERHGYSGILNIRELGVIPSAKHHAAFRANGRKLLTGAHNAAAIEPATLDEPSWLLAESFRATVASILFSPGFGQRRGVLTVTSVDPQEGKTTTAINLGIALTETHASVLLIDADLRRPGLHKLFQHCNDTGLTTALAGDERVGDLKFESLVQATNMPGLFVLPSGPDVANVMPLLHSARMSELLAQARKEFDYVLIDTPPTALFSDARVIGRLSDSVILVIHAAKTNRGELNAACQHFMEDGTHVLGTILNHYDVKVRRESYSRYVYRHG